MVYDGFNNLIWDQTAGGSGDVTLAALASTATGKGSKLVAFIQRITGAVARWVEDKLGERISVKDFGAVGDGVTDDTAALASFATAIAGKRGFINAGTYLTTSTLVFPSNCTVIGDGPGVATILQGASFPTTSPVIQLGTSNCQIRDITVDGNYPSNTSYAAASIYSPPSASNNSIRNVIFTRWNFIALSFQSNELIDGCTFTGNGTTTITPSQYGVWYDISTANVRISNCIFTNIATNSIIGGGNSTITGCSFSEHGTYTGIDSGAIYSSGNNKSMVIAGNTFTASGAKGVGIESTVGDMVITGNYITGQAAYGIICEGNGTTTISGNTITYCYSGINVQANVNNFSICGNTLYGSSNAQIEILAGTSNNYVITGNRLSGGVATLLDGGSGTTKNITNNLGFNPMGPVAITVGASPYSFTNATGYPIIVYVYNGVVSSVTLHGITAGVSTNGVYPLPMGETISVAYTAAPSMFYEGA